jgi:hypothetical protein
MAYELNEQQLRALQMCLRHTAWALEVVLEPKTGCATVGVAFYAAKLAAADVAELQAIFGMKEKK